VAASQCALTSPLRSAPSPALKKLLRRPWRAAELRHAANRAGWSLLSAGLSPADGAARPLISHESMA
jgi:hypothetical protein